MEEQVKYGDNSSLIKRAELGLDWAKIEPKKSIYTEIIEERQRQEAKWGQQNHPIVIINRDPEDSYEDAVASKYEIPTESRSKILCESAVLTKSLTWAEILIEEVSEALCAKTKKEQRKELIEVAAVAIAAIESLDRNGR